MIIISTLNLSLRNEREEKKMNNGKFERWCPILLLFLILSCNSKSENEKNKIEGKMSNTEKFILLSNDFQDSSEIPSKFTCDGANLNPELHWQGVPEAAKSLALVMDDPDAPGGVFTHWIVFDIPITMNRIEQGAKLPKGIVELPNDFGKRGYGGPCPPRGTHRYIFTLYALDTEKFDGTQSNYKSFLSKHTIAKTQLMGLYKRKS